jgi:hypothetical protein
VTDPPRPTPVEKLFGLVLWIIRVLDTRSMYGPFPRPLAQAIRARVQAISRLFRRIAEQVAAGTYVPRRLSGPRRPPTITRPRRPGPLPREAGWLRNLLPEEAPNLAGNLYALLADPATAAVIEAAPGPLRRPLRSLCHMLALDPPPVLATPAEARREAARQAAARQAAAAAERDPPPPRPPPAPPPSAQPPPRRPSRVALVLEYVNGRPRLVWT